MTWLEISSISDRLRLHPYSDIFRDVLRRVMRKRAFYLICLFFVASAFDASTSMPFVLRSVNEAT